MLLRRQWKWQRFRQSCETASPARDPSCARAWRSWRGPFSGAKKRLERPKPDDVLVLNREGSNKLIDLNRIVADQSELQRLYKRDPKALQVLVETETSAAEIKELKNRRDVVNTMQSWLDDHEAFAEAKNAAGGAEKAWQNLLEANPWVLGVGLGSRLYTTWDEGKLEQTVRGANLHTSGKCADAFLVSNGLQRSVALAEIKHPDTPLLTRHQYRSDVYGISRKFSVAIAQVQETVRAAKESLAGWIGEGQRGRKHRRRCVFGRATLVSGNRFHERLVQRRREPD